MKNKDLKLLYTQEKIQSRIKELGAEIDNFYANEPLVVICVLKGACIFFADLVRTIDNPNLELDFIKVSSYGVGKKSSGTISFDKDVSISIANKHILIVEDIVDTGLTLSFLQENFSKRGAKSVKVAALVDKTESRQYIVDVHFVCFLLNKGFIVGYGMDFAEKYRELPAIYEVISQ